MAFADADLYALLTNPPQAGLFAAIGGAVYKACVAIQNESAGTANHANRLLFANAVLANVAAKLPEKVRLMFGDVLADGTIGALANPGTGATDGMVENRVNGLLSVPASLANYGT